MTTLAPRVEPKEEKDKTVKVDTAKVTSISQQIQASFQKPGTTIENRGISIIIYGDGGVGKTSLIKTLLGWEHGKGYVNKPYCKPEEIFVINIEAGESVLRRGDDKKLVVTLYEVKQEADSLIKFSGLIQYLYENPHPFKFIFVDNMTELEKFYLIALTRSKELNVPRQKEWGDTSYYLRKTIRDLRNLTYKDINIIFNFWKMIVPIEDADGHLTSYEAPMVMRSTTMEYIGLVDHTAMMGISKEGTRFLQFESDCRVMAKHRDSGDGPSVLENYERADLAAIFTKLRGPSGLTKA